MDVAALRGICLGFPGAFEDFPFGPETSVFKVRAAVSGGPATKPRCSRCPPWTSDDFAVSLKCEPALAEQLRAAHPEITGAWHLNKKHWNGVRLDGSLPDEMVRDMVEDSYDLVVASLSRPPAGAAGLGAAGRRPGVNARIAPGELNYPGIGSTSEGRSPEGFDRFRTHAHLGEGLETYRRVAEGILTWQLQRRSGLRVRTETDAVVPGARGLSADSASDLSGSTRPARSCGSAARCPATGRNRAGFGYGTLPGHPVRGEEAFEVSIDAAGAVTFTITAFSRHVQLVLRRRRGRGQGGPKTHHFPIH